MLSANDLRKIAARSGARDIDNVEIDAVLTFLLQLFTEKGIRDHVAFKGGTMLRKMVFGPVGRLSTDLDFTRPTGLLHRSGKTLAPIGSSPPEQPPGAPPHHGERS